jgi:hypothetical protein
MSFKKVSNKNDFNSLINNLVNNRKQLRENINSEVSGVAIREEKQVMQQKPTTDRLKEVKKEVAKLEQTVALASTPSAPSSALSVIPASSSSSSLPNLPTTSKISPFDMLSSTWAGSTQNQSEISPIIDMNDNISTLYAKIGEHGEIDIENLSNNIVTVKNIETGAPERNFPLTVGLMTLLQNPFNKNKKKTAEESINE